MALARWRLQGTALQSESGLAEPRGVAGPVQPGEGGAPCARSVLSGAGRASCPVGWAEDFEFEHGSLVPGMRLNVLFLPVQP